MSISYQTMFYFNTCMQWQPRRNFVVKNNALWLYIHYKLEDCTEFFTGKEFQNYFNFFFLLKLKNMISFGVAQLQIWGQFLHFWFCDIAFLFSFWWLNSFKIVKWWKTSIAWDQRWSSICRRWVFHINEHLLQCMQAKATSKNFRCKEQYNLLLLRLKYWGLNQKFVQERDFKIASEFLSSEIEKSDQFRNRTITNIGAVFTFLILGYCISFFVLMVELIQNRKRKK